MAKFPDTIFIAEIKRRGMWRTIIFSDGSELKASLKTIDKLGLTAGLTLDAAEYEQLKAVLEAKYAVYTAEALLARRAHSVGEFKRKLRNKEISAQLIYEIAADFKARGLLDDYKYSLLRINSLLARKPAGRAFLIADLQNRLVPRAIAEKAAAEALREVDEIDLAITLLEKRRSAFSKIDIETARRKAYNYLSRRAISYQAAKRAFEELFLKRDD